MKYNILFVAIIAILATGCKQKLAGGITISPDAGTTYNAGKPVSIKVSYPADMKPDSIVYLLDSVRFASTKDSASITLKTDTLHMGSRLITAKLFTGGKSIEQSTNIMVYAAKAPEELKFTVEKVFPHDTASYTEGLFYQDGVMWESDGGIASEPSTGQSSLRKYDVETGKILQKVNGDPKIFAEGIAIVGNKLIQLTYTEQKLLEYDKTTFKLLNTLPFSVGVQGWGMCFDGKQLYFDDSTNRIWFLNKDTYRPQGSIDVCDDKGPINQVNELEMIDGKLYANIYTTDTIIVIDPKTGAVLQRCDMSKLYPHRVPPAEVLNGIAWDAAGKRLFVTGKKWQKLYQVKFEKK